MPPRKNPAAAKPDKGKGKEKATSSKPATAKGKSKGKVTTSTQNSKKRKAPTTNEPKSPPKPWDQGIRSNAVRERDRFKISRSTLDSEDDLTPAQIDAFAASLNRTSAETWGLTSSQPLKGTRKKPKRGPIPTNPRWDDEETQRFLTKMQLGANTRVAVPNDLSDPKKGILRVSTEVREVIYGFLFIHDKPIIVKYKWEAIERNPFGKNAHKLIKVSKQFALEVPAFILRNNTINALLRIPSGHRHLHDDEDRSIPQFQFANFRNMVLTCSKDCWNPDWFEKASGGLANVAAHNPEIELFTMVVTPQGVLRSDTALGTEDSPVTFADFLWWDGAFMEAVRRLAPKIFKVIVKKGAEKELTFEVNMSLYRRIPMMIGPLANALTVTEANRKSRVVERKLRGLKTLFEHIYDNDARVVAQGRCTSAVQEENAIVKTGEGHYRRLSRSQIPAGAETYVPKVPVIDLTGDSDDDDDGNSVNLLGGSSQESGVQPGPWGLSAAHANSSFSSTAFPPGSGKADSHVEPVIPSDSAMEATGTVLPTGSTTVNSTLSNNPLPSDSASAIGISFTNPAQPSAPGSITAHSSFTSGCTTFSASFQTQATSFSVPLQDPDNGVWGVSF